MDDEQHREEVSEHNQPLPMVVILGRPNVGKSSIFNQLVRSRIAIEDPIPGTTRDRISFQYRLMDRVFELVDAAGVGLVDEQRLEEHVEEQITFALERADLLIMVTDIKEGLVPLDMQVARLVRKQSKPVIVVANKADAPHQDNLAGVFHRLGLGEPLTFSARERRGRDELEELIFESLPPKRASENIESVLSTLRFAVVGKRNSGKSSLINFLSKDQRLIVNELPGTTRDSVDVHFKYQDLELTAIDTAGIQRKRSIANSVEFYSQARALKAIKRADVVIHLMDCLEATSKLDRKLAEAALEASKPVVIGVNKWDLVEPGVKLKDFKTYIEAKLPMLRFAPLSRVSVHQGLGCFELLEQTLNLHKQAHFRAGTGELNRAVQEAFDRHKPRSRYGKPAKLFYATQVSAAPPTILIYVNDSRIFRGAWNDYIQNQLRKRFDFSHIPLRIAFKNRERVTLDAKGGSKTK